MLVIYVPISSWFSVLWKWWWQVMAYSCNPYGPPPLQL